MPKMCSFGCAPSGVAMHRFPKSDKYPERFKCWVNFVGGKLETISDFEYYQKKVICDHHFTAQDRTRNNRLNALAVPTLKHEQSADVRPDSALIYQPSISHIFKTENKLEQMDMKDFSYLLSTSVASKTGIVEEHNYSKASRLNRRTTTESDDMSATAELDTAIVQTTGFRYVVP